ncbi:uncharacterized protein LOC120357495 [Solenopsis invicta]|uniref:uncharacterized protein LOC120357495 n=1 Tax=Solenopsis invicta TaxID=13686 RepID=UPI00193D02A9|nr:uncharacterized protein LOC120357495 [Solenopsis invicta]
MLERMGLVVDRSRPSPTIVAGDFNAKLEECGSPATCLRGDSLGNWALELGLNFLNRGSADTCVRHNGGSIVDFTLGCPRASRMVSGWKVLEGEETLSDHRYIRFRVSDPSSGRQRLAKRTSRMLAARGGARCRAAGPSGSSMLTP